MYFKNFIFNDIIQNILYTKSADLHNKYNKISNFCYTYNEPVFITKNRKGYLCVMCIETYEMLTARQELYFELKIIGISLSIIIYYFTKSKKLKNKSKLSAFYMQLNILNHNIQTPSYPENLFYISIILVKNNKNIDLV